MVDPQGMISPPDASIVIPAYNEGVLVDRCLAPFSDARNLRVIVVANGCHDDTADRARKHGVEVVELPQASKIAALNAGDAAAGEIMPRIYLDADIKISLDSALRVARALLEYD